MVPKFFVLGKDLRLRFLSVDYGWAKIDSFVFYKQWRTTWRVAYAVFAAESNLNRAQREELRAVPFSS